VTVYKVIVGVYLNVLSNKSTLDGCDIMMKED
jgi:hypothetical protein